MNEYLLQLLTKYKEKGILVDTNILLLYLVGSLDINLIRNFSRTAMFTEKDFDFVSRFIDSFTVKITTPHILTEVSNLFGNRTDLHVILKGFLKLVDEKFLESIEVADTKPFLDFGLTDTAIIETSKNSYLILTDDKPFFGYLLSKGIDAVSLHQLRMI